ncbi:MAG: Glycosyl transferase group 1 [Candidatus Gottesmanbacteria bacterium GW2011_GWA1_34_13]|uniref:Glycosyl transferase group 1 n=1 Tax=Candidatus Gottesmanbacteria bacterium GW2011_GWA1_34_13 TaxID=1618434 RepID=A0A0G0ASN5_9BACT|nr:MAG: Glycosyl transferase group 1 [Candidatus Gottesmanbacteria bacterium GW2011_GWA1_34_13]
MLTPYLPYPLLSGGQIRSFNLLKNLASKHQITLVALIKHDNEKQFIPYIQQYCHKVIVAKRPEKPWTFRNIIKTIFGLYPFLVVRNFSSEAKTAVIEELKTNKFDLIHAETFYVMPHIPKTNVPILLVEQTIEYLVYQHFVDTLKIFFLRWLFAIDVYKIRYWEEYYWKQAKRIVAMSEPDKLMMKKRLKSLDVSIVPNGVDCDFFTFRKNIPKDNSTILFVGNFKWLQNREAVLELVNKIWPKISTKVKTAKLWIVGKFPTREILALNSVRIKISADVEDIRDAYYKSDVLLAPIYGPGGTRYKILEAMASGIPVVTTPQGIEGLGVIDGKQAIIRKNLDDLAQATIEVLKNKNLYATLSENANAIVRNTYNWEVIARSLDKIYEDVAHEK